MVETAVAATVFAVILAAMPCVLQYHDMQRAALRSARDAVFLAAWDNGRQGPVVGLEVVRQTLEALPWRHSSDGAKVLSDEHDAAVRLQDAAPPGEAARLLEFIATPLRGAGQDLGTSFELSGTGYRRARTTVQVPVLRGAPEPFSDLDLTLTESAVALTDAWNAGGSTHVAQRVIGLVPSAKLRAARAPLDAFGPLLRVLEPAFAELCIGLIEPERVPERRLRGLVTASSPGASIDARRCR
jgi:hypothetical protein